MKKENLNAKKPPKSLHFVLSNVYIQVTTPLLQEPGPGFTSAFKFRKKSSASKIKESSDLCLELPGEAGL